MSFEKNIEYLPKKLRDGAVQPGPTEYSQACSEFLNASGEDQVTQALKPLLSGLSQRCGIGPVALLPAEYLVYTKDVAAITAPLPLHGAATCLSTLKTVYEVCGIEQYNGRDRLFPALCIGHDRHGTAFHMFLSDDILLQVDEANKHGKIEGLGGMVLSLTPEDLKHTSKQLAAACTTFPEFLYQLSRSSCCGSVDALVMFCFDIYGAGVVTSPCREEQRPFVEQAMGTSLKVNIEAAWKSKQFQFLLTMLDE